MDFKKNWAKLTLAAIAGILGLLFLISIFVPVDTFGFGIKASGLDYAETSLNTFLSGYVIPALFFLGVCAYILLKLFDIEINKYIMLAVGAINLILFVIALIDMPAIPGFIGLELMSWAHMAIFALFPLIKGISKLCCADEAPAKAAPKAAAK